MPVPKCESEGASIVLLGSFNPGIFQPAWFGAHGLIRPNCEFYPFEQVTRWNARHGTEETERRLE
jgi:hypothetical protein